MNTHAEDKDFLFLDREMLMKLKTQNVKCLPVGPFSHDSSHMIHFDFNKDL